MRKSISKKLRFEVFKRDGFVCRYCGSKPPQVPLEIDHIMPVSKGGTNIIDNLISSCFDCNRGKSDINLTSVPESIEERTAKMKAAVKQHKEFAKLVDAQNNIRKWEQHTVEAVFLDYFPESRWQLSKFSASIRMFIDKLGVQKCSENMNKACLKINYDKYTLKYFCGICWTQIKEVKNG